jgi:hypothetical protein
LIAVTNANAPLAAFLKDDANFVNVRPPPPIDRPLFQLIADEFTSVANSNTAFHEWFTQDHKTKLTLLEIQMLSYLRALLKSSADAPQQLLAVQALIEPWAIPGDVSPIVRCTLVDCARTLKPKDVATRHRSHFYDGTPLACIKEAFAFRATATGNGFQVVSVSGLAPTFSTLIWRLYRDVAPIEFPKVHFILRLVPEIRRMRKLVKLMEFLKFVELFFARHHLALYFVLNCTTFLDDPNRLTLQHHAAWRAQFLAIFPSEYPFAPSDLGGHETAYDQLNFVRDQLISFQNKVLEILKPTCEVSFPFSHFLPMMSFANVSLVNFLALYSVTGLDENEPERALEMLLHGKTAFPFVRFTNDRFQWDEWPNTDEQVDLFGLRRSDWARGIAWEPLAAVVCKAPLRPIGSEIEKRLLFLMALLVAYDPAIALQLFTHDPVQRVAAYRPALAAAIIGAWLPPEILAGLAEAADRP